MNANLRGDVKVKGMSIEDFIKKVVSGTKSLDSEPVTENPVDIDAIIAKKMQPLDAFQDEKKIMSDALAGLLERINKLEAAVTEAPQGPPSVGFKPDIDALTVSLEKLERRVADIDALAVSVEKLERKVADMKPRRGVDQATLDTAMADIEKIMDSKIEGVETTLTQLRKELEE